MGSVMEYHTWVASKNPRDQRGFTLVEMLIVVIVIAILAMVVVPAFKTSTDDARLSTLTTNLSAMRSAVELYYLQHNDTYPGENDDKGEPAQNAAQAKKGFEYQLGRYTDEDGDASVSWSATHHLGPYVGKGAGSLPVNPLNGRNDVTCDTVTDDISVKVSDGTSGWKFYTKTGVLIANDGGHDDL